MKQAFGFDNKKEMSLRKKILIIGGSGFIGKSLVSMLISNGCDVTVLNRGNKKTNIKNEGWDFILSPPQQRIKQCKIEQI